MRPTSDRVRESLFARLPDLEGARVLELYAGTGALGIEALSRGAACVAFVERARPALACLEANLASLGLSERARILRGDVRAAVERLGRAGERFELVLMDPPYGAEDALGVLRALARAALLVPAGTLVLETSRRHPPLRVPGLALADERRYGDTLVVRYVPEERSSGERRDGEDGSGPSDGGRSGRQRAGRGEGEGGA